MKVILRDDVAGLGKTGEVVEVKPGYGLNFLLPRNKAVSATAGNVKRVEHEKAVALAAQAKFKAGAADIAKRLASVELKIARKVGDQDKLFGSVTVSDIHEALVALKHTVDRRSIHLAEPIRALGTFEVPVKLHAEIIQNIKVTVVKE